MAFTFEYPWILPKASPSMSSGIGPIRRRSSASTDICFGPQETILPVVVVPFGLPVWFFRKVEDH